MELKEAVKTFLDSRSPSSDALTASIGAIVNRLQAKETVFLDLIEAVGQELVDERYLVRAKGTLFLLSNCILQDIKCMSSKMGWYSAGFDPVCARRSGPSAGDLPYHGKYSQFSFTKLSPVR